MTQLIGPKKKPALTPGDYHLIVNDAVGELKGFDHQGRPLKFGSRTKLPCLARGVRGPSSWVWGGDTPPGLYKLGTLYVSKVWESKTAVWYPYGKYCWDMEEQENQENERGRAGICLHGGGSNAPNPLADYQVLTHTHGCVRMHNKDLEDFILPLTHEKKLGMLIRRKNNVWISVYQDR